MYILLCDASLEQVVRIEKFLYKEGFLPLVVHTVDSLVEVQKKRKTKFAVYDTDMLDINTQIEMMNLKQFFHFSYTYDNDTVYINENTTHHLTNLQEDYHNAKLLGVLLQLFFLRQGYNVSFSGKSEKINTNLPLFNPEISKFLLSLPKIQKIIFTKILTSKNDENDGIEISKLIEEIWGKFSNNYKNSLYVHMSYLRKNMDEYFENQYTIIKKDKKYRITEVTRTEKSN